MTAILVAALTDAVAELQAAIGIEDTRKLLIGLAKGLGAPEVELGPEGASTPPEPRARVDEPRLSPADKLVHGGGQ